MKVPKAVSLMVLLVSLSVALPLLLLILWIDREETRCG